MYFLCIQVLVFRHQTVKMAKLVIFEERTQFYTSYTEPILTCCKHGELYDIFGC